MRSPVKLSPRRVIVIEDDAIVVPSISIISITVEFTSRKIAYICVPKSEAVSADPFHPRMSESLKEVEDAVMLWASRLLGTLV